MRATGPGKGLGVLSPSWCSGMGRDRPAGSFPALDTFLCAHPRHRCFSLWDELIWGFNLRNSRGDAQNKPTKLKIAHTGCCCFQDKDVTRWALLGLYIKPHHDVASRHYIAPAGRCHLCKPCIADVQGCPCQRSAAGCWGGAWAAPAPREGLCQAPLPRGRSHYLLSHESLYGDLILNTAPRHKRSLQRSCTRRFRCRSGNQNTQSVTRPPRNQPYSEVGSALSHSATLTRVHGFFKVTISNKVRSLSWYKMA